MTVPLSKYFEPGQFDKLLRLGFRHRLLLLGDPMALLEIHDLPYIR